MTAFAYTRRRSGLIIMHPQGQAVPVVAAFRKKGCKTCKPIPVYARHFPGANPDRNQESAALGGVRVGDSR